MAARWWLPSASEEKVSLPPPPSRKLYLTNTKVGPGTGAEVPPQTGGTPQRRRKLKVMAMEYRRNQLALSSFSSHSGHWHWATAAPSPKEPLGAAGLKAHVYFFKQGFLKE